MIINTLELDWYSWETEETRLVSRQSYNR